MKITKRKPSSSPRIKSRTASKIKPRTNQKPKVKSTKIQKRTRKTETVKKSILTSIFGKKKSPKVFGICVISSNDEMKYIRFKSTVNQDNIIEYIPTLVKKFDECSKYTSMESAKEHLSLLKEKYGLKDAKIVE